MVAAHWRRHKKPFRPSLERCQRKRREREREERGRERWREREGEGEKEGGMWWREQEKKQVSLPQYYAWSVTRLFATQAVRRNEQLHTVNKQCMHSIVYTYAN